MRSIRSISHSQNTNANRPKGLRRASKTASHWQIYTNDQTGLDSTPYKSLIIAWKNGAPVRLSDVADVTDSVQNVRNLGLVNGQPAINITILKQPNANILETIDRINALLAAIARGDSGRHRDQRGDRPHDHDPRIAA